MHGGKYALLLHYGKCTNQITFFFNTLVFQFNSEVQHLIDSNHYIYKFTDWTQFIQTVDPVE